MIPFRTVRQYPVYPLCPRSIPSLYALGIIRQFESLNIPDPTPYLSARPVYPSISFLQFSFRLPRAQPSENFTLSDALACLSA